MLAKKTKNNKNILQDFLIYTCALQALGYGLNAFRQKLEINSDYLLSKGFSEGIALVAPYLLGLLFFYNAWMIISKRRSFDLMLSGSAILLLSLMSFMKFKGEFYGLVLPARASRFLLPMVSAVLFSTTDKKLSLNKVQNILMVLISLTFIGHGLKCLMHYQGFAAYLDSFFNGLIGLKLNEQQFHIILDIIGLVDLMAAACALLNIKRTWMLGYMFSWATIAAFSRVIHYGWIGYDQIIIRAAYIGIPLIVMWMIVQKSKLNKLSV